MFLRRLNTKKSKFLFPCIAQHCHEILLPLYPNNQRHVTVVKQTYKTFLFSVLHNHVSQSTESLRDLELNFQSLWVLRRKSLPKITEKKVFHNLQSTDKRVEIESGDKIEMQSSRKKEKNSREWIMFHVQSWLSPRDNSMIK